MQHRKAQRVCLRYVYKEGGTISHTLFCFLPSLSLIFSCTHICKFAEFSTCANPITPTNVQTHIPTYIHTVIPWELQVHITRKIFYNVIKKNKKKTIIKIHRRGLLRGRTFIRCRWLCFPLGLLSGCLISFRGVLWSWGAAATQKSFLKFLHHRFLSIFQLCTLLHLPPEEHQSAQHQPF